MKHYCIFEITHPNKHSELWESKFVTDFDDYSAAEDMRSSMSNFRKPGEEVWYVLRCLEEEEFKKIEDYDPILKRILFVTIRQR